MLVGLTAAAISEAITKHHGRSPTGIAGYFPRRTYRSVLQKVLSSRCVERRQHTYQAFAARCSSIWSYRTCENQVPVSDIHVQVLYWAETDDRGPRLRTLAQFGVLQGGWWKSTSERSQRAYVHASDRG